GNEPYFTIKCHHGGDFFDKMGRTEYLNSQVSYFDYFTIDTICKFELDHIPSLLGYSSPVGFWFKKSGMTLDVGLVRITNDKEILEMAKSVKSTREVDLFLQLLMPKKSLPWSQPIPKANIGGPSRTKPLPTEVGPSESNPIVLSSDDDDVSSKYGLEDSDGDCYEDYYGDDAFAWDFGGDNYDFLYDDWNPFEFDGPPRRKSSVVITELEDDPPPPRRKSGVVIRELEDDPPPPPRKSRVVITELEDEPPLKSKN
ncbi:hypothetical protein TorRG33x02_354260, partial [Trema orientale]